MTMTTPTPPPPQTKNNNNGIDIRDALSILSARAKDGGDADITTDSSSVPDKLKEMGQTIDIAEQMEFTKPGGCDCARNNNGDVTNGDPLNEEEENEKHEAMKQERERRGEEIRKELASMGVLDLLGMIFSAQQERVATYKLFEEGLSTILVSGNITSYPALCAKVTASFSVLSDTINAVKSSLDNEQQRSRKDITTLIAQLQKSEGEKLNLTAALHLERLRLNNCEVAEDDGGDDRTVKLLKDGIQTLECKIASDCVESINDVLEELRCIAADEE